jgi:hypothetical protein
MRLSALVFGFLLVLSTSQTLVFRLDDLQCGYLTDTGLAIINIFLDHKIPIVAGIVTLDDVSCFADELRQLYDDSQGLLEIASHSKTNPQMINMTFDQQLVEVNESKVAIESFLGQGTVRTFIPPGNAWNYDTITAVVESGYDIFSPECTGGDIGHITQDDICTSNMYVNIPAFFPRIDGVTHIPIGASISSFYDDQILISVSQLFNGTLEDCYAGNCSVELQMSASAPLTDGPLWSAIMMHPDCFPEDSDRTYLENYFAPIFEAASQFEIKTFKQLTGPVGSRPLVKGIPTPP